ncbi:MAG: HAMP domain-containing histidine kinase [Candidatus Ryanbacteria bacterium]|nr:HAMP domain-containing histidine kinase [Candidatus Ryanbacteria bacterium]
MFDFLKTIGDLTTVNLPLWHKITIIVVNALTLALVATVLNHNSIKKRITQLFLGLGVFMFLWVDFAYFARLVGSSNTEVSLLFLRIAWTATPLFFCFVYLTTIYIVERKQRDVFVYGVISLAFTLALVTWFTNYIVAGVSFVGINLDIDYGKGFFGFLFGILIIMCATLFPLVQGGKNVRLKRNTSIFLGGVSIFYVNNLIFNITLPAVFNITHLYFFGDYSLLIVIAVTAYLILQKGFLDIRVFSAELFVFALWAFILLRMTIATNNQERLISLGMLGAAITIGLFLLRSIDKEVELRKKIELLAADLEVANADLKRLDEAKSDFISIASHQLRTPLSIIKGYISMMREGTYGKLETKIHDPLEKVYVSNERLITLVNDLLDLSRMERGRMQFDMKPVHLLEILDPIVTDFQIVAKNKKMELVWEKDFKTDAMSGDVNKLRQVALNLVDNAFKYTPSGKVVVKLAQEGDAIRFSVTDTGPGLSEEESRKLFKKFVRGKEQKATHTEGLGLGLYVAKLIAEAHGGSIGATSPGKGKGSTFFMLLPLEAEKKK